MFSVPFASALFVLFAIANSHSFVNAQSEQRKHEVPSLDQLKNHVESIRPSIVLFRYDGYHFGCGVIVSPEGHIAVSGSVAAVLDNKLLELRLVDGRQVRGEALGWSSEFGVGMIKITDPGVWKFVTVADQVKVGEYCLAMGYSRNHEGDDHVPKTGLGLVDKQYKNQWFTTSHKSDFDGHPVFNMNGELLGLQTSSDGTYGTFSCGKSIKENWTGLMAGLNIDRKRLQEGTKPRMNMGDLPEKIGDDSLAKIKAAAVMIGDAGKKPVFSGVIVPNGYVITCAHHYRLPGEKLQITLADGRTAAAVVLGTNRKTDICLLKIKDEGEWPFVELGYSSRLLPGMSAILVGYPIKNEQKALVFNSQLVEKPDGGLERRDSFSTSLFLECNDKDVVINLKGASGGGVFDTDGKVVGIVSSTSSSTTFEGVFHGTIAVSRVELFHKNWLDLCNDTGVEVAAKEVEKSIVPELTKLASELEAYYIERTNR